MKSNDFNAPETDKAHWLHLPDEAATERLAVLLAANLNLAGIVFLSGQLGAGKTTLVRGILRGLGHSGPVKSPTYTLVEEYQLVTGAVFHFDLYRLADPEELEFMGVRDYLAAPALQIIEWPDKGGGMLPRPDLKVQIELDGRGRKVQLSACTEAMKTAVRRIAKQFQEDNIED